MNSKSLTILMAFLVLLSIASIGYSCKHCYTTGLVCGHALECAGAGGRGIYHCNSVGGFPSYIGPCDNGCRKDRPNHYCIRG